MSFSQAIAKMKDTVNEFNENKGKSTPIAMVAPEVKQSAEADTEITKTCAVLGCDDSKNMNDESFFRFPEDPQLRQVWTDLTGRNNWTPTDYSYICIQHFSVDCFHCDTNNDMVLNSKAVPSQKLPHHVLEVEYIDEETLDNEEDYEMDSQDEDRDSQDEHKPKFNNISHTKPATGQDQVELLRLFTEVQKMQRQAVGLRDKLRYNMRIHNRQNKKLQKLKETIEMKKKILNQKRKKKSRILLTLQDKIKEDKNGLVLAMPTRHTDDLKNFALSIYKYSPQAYIYIRNTLRTMLPSTDVLETWVDAGYTPKNVMSNSSMIKVISEQTDKELSCKVTLG
ncbi:THAP domain-containing protein 1-like [Cydia pomonella]|uniref:THAP domain-containing protein 1-like n=1 Tax=Cydia pomonella TaxID=82600 RepID=UPI002ADE4EE0|nr:THAP domain-containing protein 1-like [Cydia pomonella]